MSVAVTGFHAIEESLAAGGGGCLHVSRRDRRIEALVRLAGEKGTEVRREADIALDRLCGHRNHRGAVLVMERPSGREVVDLKGFLRELDAEQALVVLLDGITDPHNLGAILRSADQFAVELVVVPERRAAHETDTVARVSAGAHAYVPLAVVGNLAAAVGALKEADFWVYGAAAEGSPVQSVGLRGRTALIMGSEGRGLGRLLRERCDELVAVPTRGHVDSFNVSVAAGILMYEVRRQQWSGRQSKREGTPSDLE